jgi:hypothetical protein
MDPRDRLVSLPDGATCTACGAPVPTGRIRVLARRDDLAFVELDCPACGSAALGLLMAAAVPDGEPVLDLATDVSPTGTGRPGRPATLRPISKAEVEAVRDDLAAWRGDLVGWLDAIERGQGGSVAER